jgi:hypothetical protein
MKILLLTIFSHNYVFNEMLKIQRKYIHHNKNIDVYFVTFDEEMTEDIKINNDIIYVKGKESNITILYKTIKSLDHIINTLGEKYDYIVRSNISTIINLNNLYSYLSTSPKTNLYTGGKLEIIHWELSPNEISEYKQDQRNKFFGLKFIQGIGIILSYDIVKQILNDANSIEYDIVDDVKLGLIIRDKFPEIYNNISNTSLANVSYYHITKESIFIRNKNNYNNDRLNDINNMLNIVYKLYNV